MARKPKTATTAAPAGSPVTEEQRHQFIAAEAYYRAERRGFRQGDPFLDWLEAEAEIDRRLAQSSTAAHVTSAATKRAFVEKLNEELRDFDARLEHLHQQAGKAKRAVRIEYESLIEILTEKRATADRWLREWRGRSEATWADLSAEAEKLWRELRETIDEAASRFK